MTSRTTENTNGRSADRTASRRGVMIFAAAVMMTAAAGSMRGDAGAERVGVEATDAPVQVADRTLVPRRIRLIIGYKRPRLA